MLSVTKLFNKESKNNQENSINFFFKTSNAIDFNKEEKCLRNILNSHLKTKDTSKIKVRLYHKSKQLASSFSTRDALPDRHHVVYQFNCSELDCTSTYIGYTKNRLSDRAYQHLYSPSKIFGHFNTAHGQSTISNISKHHNIIRIV